MQKYIGSSDFPEAWKNNTANIYMSCGEEENLKSVAFFSGLNINISIRKEVSSSAKGFFLITQLFKKPEFYPESCPGTSKKRIKWPAKLDGIRWKDKIPVPKSKQNKQKAEASEYNLSISFVDSPLTFFICYLMSS